MPYSKAWRNAMFPDYREQGAYVDYKAMKNVLHHMKENIANSTTPDELYHSLLKQKEMVYYWCQKKQAELLQIAEALYMTSEGLVASEEDDLYNSRSFVIDAAAKDMRHLSPKAARLLADAIIYELLRFVECRNLNMDTIEHIIGRMYRYAVLGPTGDRWKNVYTMFDFYDLSLDEVFFFLSKVYDRALVAEETRHTAKDQSRLNVNAVGSQVFDRRSVKYWVHMQDLPFVIARIIPHISLSTFKDTYKQCKEKNVPFKLHSPVSSVYWDNNKFLFYNRRLERIEGSTLVRMRWYSDTYAQDWNKIDPNDNVFMEIKVHHEAWSGDRSNKRRFAIQEKDVDRFVQGQLSLVPALEKLKSAGKKEREKFKSLAVEILSKIHAYDLKPVLRTQCARAAFQRGADQSVRVSIDIDLRLSAEDFGLSHHWRYLGDDVPVSHFPYAVVEIKLQCAENERIAPWIEELMACRYMESVPKFSKYAHGIASLYGHTSFISMVPYWMHQMDMDIRASTKPEQQHWDPTVGLASGCWERLTDCVIFGTAAAQTQSVGASEAKFLPRSDYAQIYQNLLSAQREGGRQQLISSFFGKAEGARHRVEQYDVDYRQLSYTKFHLYPYTESGRESVCFSPKGKNAAAEVFTGKIPWQTGKRIKVPQKYDPKTLLTSERYMVKWMQFATQFGLLGLAIIHFGKGLFFVGNLHRFTFFWTGKFHVVLGVSMVTVSVLTLIYAYLTFHARARRVYARRKVRYDSVFTPTWLTFFVIFSMLVLLSAHVTQRYGPMLSGNDAF